MREARSHPEQTSRSIAQAVLTLPALGGSAVNIGAFVIVVYDLFFVQQAHTVKAENKDRL